MFIKNLRDCAEFTAGDGSILRELLHPNKEDLRINYSLAFATVRPSQKTTLHKLKTSEVYYILQGQGLMQIDQEHAEVSEGCAIYIPPDSVQSIENTGNCQLKFLCIVEPAWRLKDERIFDS